MAIFIFMVQIETFDQNYFFKQEGSMVRRLFKRIFSKKTFSKLVTKNKKKFLRIALFALTVVSFVSPAFASETEAVKCASCSSPEKLRANTAAAYFFSGYCATMSFSWKN